MIVFAVPNFGVILQTIQLPYVLQQGLCNINGKSWFHLIGRTHTMVAKVAIDSNYVRLGWLKSKLFSFYSLGKLGGQNQFKIYQNPEKNYRKSEILFRCYQHHKKAPQKPLHIKFIMVEFCQKFQFYSEKNESQRSGLLLQNFLLCNTIVSFFSSISDTNTLGVFSFFFFSTLLR